MQQAVVANQPSSVGRRSGTLPADAPQNAFVINLCSSTTPVALRPPDHAGLKRFTFFVSRRREEGRERFRLHMGYFETQEEAEKLLDIVREIYPGAWAGAAPGQQLRAAVADAASAAAAAAQGASAMRPAPAGAASAAVPVPPVPQAAAARAVAPSRAATVSPAADRAAMNDAALELVPDSGRRLPAAGSADTDEVAATQSLNNVRAAIASLGDSAERAPVLRPIPQLKPAAARAPLVRASAPANPPRLAAAAPAAPRRPPAAAPPAPAARAFRVDTEVEISNAQALNVLEGGAADFAPTVRQPRAAAAANAKGPSGAERSAEQASPRDEKAFYAVQLMWSVQPIDITAVPQLAIFSAYTLYGAEGNRDGRRWYGLRLGFFTDAVSAKQVAHYVRSEFATVSVVPVTTRERERAKLAVSRPPGSEAAPARGAAPAKPGKTEFEFIEDKQPESAKPGAANRPTPPRPSIGARAARGAPGKRAKLRTAGQVNARSKSKPMTLEETLEILGAGELRMDDTREASINESGVRHLRLEPVKGNKPSRLGRLFDRLSERLGS